MALGRGRSVDCGREALAVARSRPDRAGAGHPGAEPARHAGRQAPAAQAAEEADPPASRHGDRQAGELRGGQARGDALGRAQEAQGAEQQGGELAPADAAAGAADEAVQVAWPSTTLSLPTTGSATCSTSAAIKFQPRTIEPPGSKPSRFGLRSPASPLRRNHGYAVLIARHRDLSPTS